MLFEAIYYNKLVLKGRLESEQEADLQRHGSLEIRRSPFSKQQLLVRKTRYSSLSLFLSLSLSFSLTSHLILVASFEVKLEMSKWDFWRQQNKVSILVCFLLKRLVWVEPWMKDLETHRLNLAMIGREFWGPTCNAYPMINPYWSVLQPHSFLAFRTGDMGTKYLKELHPAYQPMKEMLRMILSAANDQGITWVVVAAVLVLNHLVHFLFKRNLSEKNLPDWVLQIQS